MQSSASTPCTITMIRTAPMPGRRREDAVHFELVGAYNLCGGLATTAELIQRMRPYWRQPASVLGRWIAGHKVLTFSMREQTLLPLFQFERPRLTPYGGIADAALELADVMKDEDLAAWFLRPCDSLDHERPADVVPVDPDRVAGAARRLRKMLMCRRLQN